LTVHLKDSYTSADKYRSNPSNQHSGFPAQ
jgi:hypothetical protein